MRHRLWLERAPARSALALLLVVVAAAACASSPRQHEDYLLLGRIQDAILRHELERGFRFGGQVTGTRIISGQGGSRTEAWTVRRGDTKVVYTVILHTRLGGTIEYEVIPPEEDRA